MKRMHLFFISTTLAAFALFALATVRNAQAVELVVPTDFATIQSAIGAANAAGGDSILVEPGTYTGPVMLKSNVPIRGRETARTIIQGGTSGTVTASTGVVADNVTGVTVKNFTFENATVAVAVTNSDLVVSNDVFSLGTGSTTAVKVLNTTAASPQVVNNTFYLNSIAVSSNVNLTIKNNIFNGNTTDITPTSLSTTTITYNAFSAVTPVAPNLTGSTGNITNTNPLFVNPAGLDFHLTAGSPCIDAGDPSITDFIDSTRSDIGAYGGNNTQDSIPFRVSGLAVTSTSAATNSITLNWAANNCYLITTDSAANHPRGYRVYYGSTRSGLYNGTDAAAGNSPITVDLHAGANAPSTLDSLNPATASLSSAPVLAQPTPSNQTLTLAWTAVAGATGYKVHWGIASPNENVIDVGPTLTYSLQGLVNGQTYQIAVSAYSQATYYLVVTAFDNSGFLTPSPGVSHESFYSSEVQQRLGPMIESGPSNVVSDFPEAIVPFPNLPRKGCFIATAAFDNPDALPVRALREFRDRYLVTNGPGRAFVRWYYENGPQLAAFLNDHPWLKPAVRTALIPAAGAAFFMTRTPLTVQLLFLLALIGALGWRIRRGRGPRQEGGPR